MKLLIILFGFPLAFCYVENYKGFNECGLDGWTCGSKKDSAEVTYTCTPKDPNARVWVWTARLPTGTRIFTVRNCVHLEVHMDCTTGFRAALLRQFNVINVTHLEILRPLKPHVFLHDNDQIPQVPPVLFFKNIGQTEFYPGLFDKPGGGCRFQFIELVSLSLINVHVDRLMKGLFHNNQNLDRFVMKDVVINSIDSNAVNMNTELLVINTTVPFLPFNAITVKGENVSFINNTFKRIQGTGLNIKTKDFTFSNNYVEELNTQGFSILGANIQITNNVFDHLETGAFEKITPGYSPVSYQVASKFIYNFSNNIVKNINPGSLHLNWEIYKLVCSEIIFYNNTFDCSCTNLGWISVSNGLGPKISKVKEFYDEYLTKENSICSGHKNCPLKAVIDQIQDVCNNKTNVSSICTSYEIALYDNTSYVGDETVTENNSTLNLTEITQQMPNTTNLPEVSEKIIPVLSFTENQTSYKENTPIPLWIIVVPILVVLAATSLGIFIWWYNKKKQRQLLTTMYKNERGADADSLIVINEHYNELYDKQ